MRVESIRATYRLTAQEIQMEKDSQGFDIAECESCGDKYVAGVMSKTKTGYVCGAHV